MTGFKTITQLAAAHGVCEDTVRRDIALRRLEAFRVGRRVLIPEAAARAWRQPVPVAPAPLSINEGPRPAA